MSVHMRAHTGSKPYACPACSKRFSSSSDRDKHMRVHTGSKPFACPRCSARFTHTGSRDTHVKRKHAGEA